MQQTLRRPRPMRPPVSIHMMPDFSAYDSCNTQSVSAVPTGTAQPGPAFYSHKLLKRKRSESTDDSDDPEGRGYSYPHTRHPSLGRQYPVAESGYAPTKSDESGHIAKRARLADDFAELRLRGQSLSPTSGISPAAVPLWAPAPETVLEARTSPQLPPPPVGEIDLTDEYGRHVRSRRSAHVALPHLPAPIPSEIDVDIPPTNILRGEVEEVVSPGVQAERSKSKPAADGNEHDIRMHGTSSYEPEKDRIIITDLDDFSDSEGESSTTPPFMSTPTPTSGPYKISSAYLSRFGNIPRAEFDFDGLGDVDDRQALIAYRPLVQTINALPSHPKVFTGYIEEVEDGVVGSPTTVQDTYPDTDDFVVEPYPEDAMDIDM